MHHDNNHTHDNLRIFLVHRADWRIHIQRHWSLWRWPILHARLGAAAVRWWLLLSPWHFLNTRVVLWVARLVLHLCVCAAVSCRVLLSFRCNCCVALSCWIFMCSRIIQWYKHDLSIWLLLPCRHTNADSL